MTAQTTVGAGRSDAGEVACWCCAWTGPESGVVRLGSHSDVAVCLRWAHWLHRQARGREDGGRPSPGTRVRDGLRAGRQLVMRRGWHQKPVIGRLLGWLGPRLP